MIKVVICFLMLFLAAEYSLPQQKEKLVISSGAFGILDADNVFMGSVDLLIENKEWFIDPKMGVMFTSANSICSYFGFIFRQPVMYGLSLSFSFAPGFYYSFKEDKLGHILEFNSGVELTYELTASRRISISFHHISNGGLAKFNPGAEFLLVSYTIPLRN